MNVFCLEGRWSTDLRDKSSVRPVLEVLRDTGGIEFIHKPIVVREAFQHVARAWRLKRYKDYRLGYFTFHGEPGALQIGRNKLTIERLAAYFGRCPGKVVFLSGCSVLPPARGRKVPPDVSEFLTATGAVALCGYTEEVDWIKSMAFDMLLIDWINEHPARPRVGIRKAEEESPTLAKKVGFVSYPR